jgi:serine/threonine protein kinase
MHNKGIMHRDLKP